MMHLLNAGFASLTFITEYTNIAVIYVDHVLRLIGNIEAKALADRTVPRGTKLFI